MRKVLVKGLNLLVFSAFISGCASLPSAMPDTIGKEKIYSAIGDYAKLIEINKAKLEKKDSPSTRIALAQNYYEIGDFDSTLYYIAPLIASGKNANALLLKAKVLEAKGELEGSMKEVQKALSLSPKLASAHNLKGVLLSREGEFKQAKESFLQAKALFLPDEIINNNLAMLALLELKHNEAVGYLMPLYNRGMRDTTLVSNLVFALAKSGQPKKAAQIAKEARLSKTPELLVDDIVGASISPKVLFSQN